MRRRVDSGVAGCSGYLRLDRGFRFAFQKAFELSAIDPKGCGGELGKCCRGGVFIDEAILDDRFQAFVELAGEGLIVPLHKSLDAAEVGEVGGDRGGLVEVSELSFLGPDDVGVTKSVFQGLGVLLKGLEFDRSPFRGVSGCCSCILVEEQLEPVVHGSIEVTRGKENFLRFGNEEFWAAEEVVAALGEVEV